MTDLRQAAQQALEALESSRIFVITREKTKHPEGTEWYDSAITALREALAQPEQGPTQWREMVVVSLVREGIDKHKARELADHFAAQRPWQGLTDEEIWSAVSRIGTADSDVNPYITIKDARAIEAKLKGKNYDTSRTQVG